MKYFYLNICLPVLLLQVFLLSGKKASPSYYTNSRSGALDTIKGTVTIFITDDFRNQKSITNYCLASDDGKIYHLETSPDIKAYRSGDKIRIIGTEMMSGTKSNTLKSAVIEKSQIDLIERKKSVTENNYGEQKYAVILFNFRNDYRRPFSKETVEELFFGQVNSANANIREMSHGKTWLTGDVFDNDGRYYTIDMDAPTPFEEVNELLILALARAAADKDIDYQNYKSIIHILPDQPAFSWAGAGTTNPVFMKTEDGDLMKHYVAINGVLNEFVATHEVMHNFGVGHDSKRFYPEGIFFGEPLGFDPYGNVFSFMGNGYGHISLSFSKYIWPEEFNVTEISKSGTYSIELAAIADTAARKSGYIQGITVPRDLTSEWTIEYRDKVGMDAENNWMNILGAGLVVYLTEHDYDSDIQTFSPYQDDSQHPDIIKMNEEFTDPLTGLRVRSLGATPEGLLNVSLIWQPGMENIRVNKRDLKWPKMAVKNHSEKLNFSLFNNAYVDISDTFEVALYQKFENGEWEIVEGQNRIIPEFMGGATIRDTFEWTPHLAGTYYLQVIADSQSKLNELSQFDNYTPKGQTGYPIEVIEECESIEVKEYITICEGDSYHNWSNSGQYRREYLSASGCDSIITTILSVNDLPNIELTVKGDTLTSVDTFAAYQWYNQDGIIEGATSNQFIISENGSYSLEVTDTYGCSALSEEMNLIKTNSIEITSEQLKFSVLPNPNDGIFRVKIENGKTGKYRIQILNKLGQSQITKDIYINNTMYIAKFELSHLPKGNYFIKVSGDADSFSRKIVLQ